MIVDKLKNWQLYSSSVIWQCAFDYLTSLTPESAVTEMVPLLGEEVKARVMVYETLDASSAALEAHDNYVDIQMTLDGGECLDWFPRSVLKVKTPYDPASDAAFFERPDMAPVRVTNLPGQFVVFFPEDAHSPQLNVGASPATVKKVVVKVRRATLLPLLK